MLQCKTWYKIFRTALVGWVPETYFSAHWQMSRHSQNKKGIVFFVLWINESLITLT
jgi:hypothetical protein